jgi:hypothetical protein
MFPISYLIFPLIVFYLYDKQMASYFYPFVLVSSTVGIIFNILLLTYVPFRKIFYNYFPYSLSIKSNFKIVFYISFIILKLFIWYYWPKNTSKKAYIYSSMLIVFYFIFRAFNNTS